MTSCWLVHIYWRFGGTLSRNMNELRPSEHWKALASRLGVPSLNTWTVNSPRSSYWYYPANAKIVLSFHTYSMKGNPSMMEWIIFLVSNDPTSNETPQRMEGDYILYYDDNFFTNLMHKFFILIHLLHSSTCYEHYYAHLQEDNCVSTASGIVTLETSEWSKLIITCFQSDDTRYCSNTIVLLKISTIVLETCRVMK